MRGKLMMAVLVIAAASTSVYAQTKTGSAQSDNGQGTDKINPYTEGAKQA